MGLIFFPKSRQDLEYFKRLNNSAINKKIEQLLKSIQETPFTGIGKPEALKYNLSGLWSRRINGEHRIVYEVLEAENDIIIHSFKGHY